MLKRGTQAMDKQNADICQAFPPRVLDLMLDVVLEVMRAECGSIMLLDDNQEELSVRSARGLREEIMRKARTRLGCGVAGKVVRSGRSVLLQGGEGEAKLDIRAEDLVNPGIHTSYVMPIKLNESTIGTVNVNSTRPDHDIPVEREALVQGIIHRFLEYLGQAELPPVPSGSPSQLYMMNVFREYSMLRQVRSVLDFLFELVANLLGAPRKGLFLLKDQEGGFFDLVLGYGIETENYQGIYEALIPRLKEASLPSEGIHVIHRTRLCTEPVPFCPEAFYVLIPILWADRLQGLLLIMTPEKITVETSTQELLTSICGIAGKIIEEGGTDRKFQDLSQTDSLTGTYNYGLWWKRVNEEMSRIQRAQEGRMAVIVLDIDRLDRFNRAHGYLAGDHLLRVMADRIKDTLRTSDIVGRIGGDEFGIALPNTGMDQAEGVARRILQVAKGIPSELHIEPSHPFTLSGGVAGFPGDAETPERLVEQAKTALVSSKILGGDRIQRFVHAEE